MDGINRRAPVIISITVARIRLLSAISHRFGLLLWIVIAIPTTCLMLIKQQT